MPQQLTEVRIRAIKASGRIERFHDSGGLYLETSKAGGKYWRWKYHFEGKEKRLSLGAWPAISLKEARDRRDNFRKILRSGTDPSTIKKITSPLNDAIPTFEDIAREFVEKQRNIWSLRNTDITERILKKDILPHLGTRPISSINPRDVLGVLRIIEDRQALNLAARALRICSMIFRYGVAVSIVESDPCRDLRGALTPYRGKHLAAITKPNDVGTLMLDIDAYHGAASVRASLLFSALTFCRPGEIREAEWAEIDFREKMWTIPPQRTKTRIEHKVPLSRQAMHVLQELRPLTGSGQYIFPSPKDGAKPLSGTGLRLALRCMGYTSKEMSVHGFRSMASTLLNEAGKKFDVIEVQLGHKGHDRIRAIYNRAEYMKERQELMQFWADYLDELRALASTSARDAGFSGS